MLRFSYKKNRLMLVRETVSVVVRVTRNTQTHDVTRRQSFVFSYSTWCT